MLAGKLLSRDMATMVSAPIVCVTDDFITRLREVRESSGDRAVVDQLSSYVYRWSLEGKARLYTMAMQYKLASTVNMSRTLRSQRIKFWLLMIAYAFSPFMVIQGHRLFHRSKAHNFQG